MNEMYDYQIDPDYVDDSLSELQEKISEMEDRSRRNNIRVDGVTEEKGETWEDCENKVLEILRDKLEIEDVTIEHAHRVKPYQNKKNNKGNASPRTIVSKLLNYKGKTGILQKCNSLKGTSYYIIDPLDGTHLVAVRGLTTKRYSTQERQREELVGAALLRPIRTNRSSLTCRCQFPDSR